MNPSDADHPDDGTAGFLIDIFHRTQGGKTTIFGIGKLETGETFGLVEDREPPRFYVRASDSGKAEILGRRRRIASEACPLSTMDGESVVQFFGGQVSSLRDLADELQQDAIRTYEADLNPALRYLMDRDLLGSLRVSGSWRRGTGVDRVYVNPRVVGFAWEPELAVLVLDIETDPKASQVYAISLVGTGPEERHRFEEVLLVGAPLPNDPPNATCFQGESELFEALVERIGGADPDIITGWNLIDFDLTVLRNRFKAYRREFNLGRTRDSSWFLDRSVWGSRRVVVRGRQVLDALHLCRAIPRRFEDNRLETVAQSVLGRGKTLQADAGETMPVRIERAYREDRRAFCEYCLEDARLVRDILEAEGLIRLSLRRSRLTGLPVERSWGSVAVFEFMYIRELHKRNFVAPTRGVDRDAPVETPGGLVIAEKLGLFRNVLVFDFKSLYPSIIRTFNIDPLSHVKANLQIERGAAKEGRFATAPNGARFCREPGILPGMLERFFANRSRAVADGDDVASVTYKILMNTFYGVLATDACRFASSKLAGAITGFGQHLLLWTKERLEKEGCRVLYGDTDSLFVDPDLPDTVGVAGIQERGNALCSACNAALARYVKAEFGVTSYLELEFEKVYRRFFLPASRAEETRARAKGYAGLRVDGAGERVEIVGMEAARRDWTGLAHALQHELLDLLFHDRPTEEIEACVTKWVDAVRSGRKEDLLVYRKALRKPLSKYVKSEPPHVKAARLLSRPSGVIRYVITTQGPQPIGRVSAGLDYDHYVEKQIAPIVRSIARVTDVDVETAITGEQRLFRGFGRRA